jgi:hypothetical protein
MRRIAALTILALATACSDEGPVATPGTLHAAVVGPNGAEGAALIYLLGDGVESVSSAGATEVYASLSDSRTRIVLIHPSGGELTFQMAVADVTDPPAWVIEDVADVNDDARPDLTAYSVEFTR